jgi:hypothetical protein
LDAIEAKALMASSSGVGVYAGAGEHEFIPATMSTLARLFTVPAITLAAAAMALDAPVTADPAEEDPSLDDAPKGPKLEDTADAAAAAAKLPRTWSIGEQVGGKDGTFEEEELVLKRSLPRAVFGWDASEAAEEDCARSDGSFSPSLSPVLYFLSPERSGTDSRRIRGSTERMYSPSLNWMSILPLVLFALTATLSQPKLVCTLIMSPTCTSGRGKDFVSVSEGLLSAL